MRRLEAEANRSAARGPLTWQLGGRNVLPVLVGQLSEASQAAAVTQHGVPRDPVIWEVHASCGHGQASDRHCKPAGTGAPAHNVGDTAGETLGDGNKGDLGTNLFPCSKIIPLA